MSSAAYLHTIYLHDMLCYFIVLIIIVLVIVIILTILGIIVYGLYNVWNIKRCNTKRRLDGKVVIVTGGTAGMGIEIAIDLALRGAKVIIACPFKDEGTTAREIIVKKTGNENVTFKLLNLASLESVRGFAKDIIRKEERLDILINNAGVIMPDTQTEDDMNYVMLVNYFGHFLLTFLLMPLLIRSGTPADRSRVINVTSKIYSRGEINIDDLNAIGLGVKMYSNSKLCITMMSKYLADKLKGSNIVVNVADPGVVGGTNIALNFGTVAKIAKLIFSPFYPSPNDGAQTTIYVALDKKAGELNGQYFLNCTLTQTADVADNMELAKKLWDKTLMLLKLNESDLQKNYRRVTI